MPRLGVLGWPVAHSRSPAMHRAAFAATGLDGWSYQQLPVPPDLFSETVRALGAAGFRGANVTIPHKQAALALADEPDPAAAQIGAANTLTFGDDGTIAAANTDAPGLIAALPFEPRGRTALILGAGGSARAAAWALREAGAAAVRVWNRSAERASELAQALAVDAVDAPAPADLLVNCTPAGLKELPLSADDLGEFACVVDLVYRDTETTLVAEARRRDRLVVDGLEILVRQGALSFESWTGLEAPIEAMRQGAHDPQRRDPTPSAGPSFGGSARP